MHMQYKKYLQDKFRLTGETGSYRYMAPEVFRHEPYNPKVRVDVCVLLRVLLCTTKYMLSH